MAVHTKDCAARRSNGKVPASAMTDVIGLVTIASEANQTILLNVGARICSDAGPPTAHQFDLVDQF